MKIRELTVEEQNQIDGGGLFYLGIFARAYVIKKSAEAIAKKIKKRRSRYNKGLGGTIIRSW